jgi:purine-binding chemotaxis protein CheW
MTLSAEEVLAARARALAQPPEEAPEVGEQLDLLAFVLDGERFAIEARHVDEVVPLPAPAPVPCTPPFVLGLIVHRGRALPVLDLDRALGGPGGGSHVEVVAVRAGELRFGIAIESVIGVERCEVARLGERQRYVRRVAGEPLAVLDLDALAADRILEVDDRNGNQGRLEA